MSLITNHAILSSAKNPYEAIVFLVFLFLNYQEKFDLVPAIVPLIHYLSLLYLTAAIASYHLCHKISL